MKQIGVILSAIALSAMANVSHAAWQHAHGDSANTGFAMVDTAPALTPQVQPLGSMAPGANPVVGPNGDVYVGNLQGELRAFHADGTPYWTRQLDPNVHGGIFAAPVVGADGSIYVVSTISRKGQDPINGVNYLSVDSYLHKFSPTGAWVFAMPFPELPQRLSDVPGLTNRGVTTAPPNIWRWDGTEAIVVPVIYPVFSAGARWGDLRLVAFSTTGTLLANQLVRLAESPETTGGDDDWLETCLALNFWNFESVCLIIAYTTGEFGFVDGGNPIPLSGAGIPLPVVAIRPDPQGGPPLIMVADANHDKIVYALSPETGFSEVNRSQHLLRQFTTPPVVLANGHTLTGTLDGHLTRTGYSFIHQVFIQLSAIGGLGTLTAAPTRLNDGRLVVIDRSGLITVLNGSSVVGQRQLAGESIASAAASCNHIFVANTNELATFDPKTLAQVASVPWTSGGLHSPIIGPSGHVYAIASNILYVFPPPWKPVWDTRPPSCFLSPPVLTQ
jgi:outer membrane protein assembly factor BamB